MPGGDDDDIFDDVEDEGHAHVAYGAETDGCTGEEPAARGGYHDDAEVRRVSGPDKPFTLFTQEGSNAGQIYNVEGAGVRRISEAGAQHDDSRLYGGLSSVGKDSYMQ